MAEDNALTSMMCPVTCHVNILDRGSIIVEIRVDLLMDFSYACDMALKTATSVYGRHFGSD